MKFFKIKFTLFLLVISFYSVLAQSSVQYTFDNCDYKEAQGLLADVTVTGNPDCVCGLNGNSLLFDGNDTLVFPKTYSDLFIRESYTFDFYFTLVDVQSDMDIFATSATCIGNDSTMTLKYLTANDELLFFMGSSSNNFMINLTKLDPSVCWHRFTLVKSETEYFYYLDNVLQERFVSRENIPVSKTNPLTFGANKCSVLGSVPMNGQLDNISWTERALSPLEIAASYVFPDQIVTRDTTIFTGSSVSIAMGSSCAQTAGWSPIDNLDLTNPFAPIATPDESTTYTSVINYRHCTITDTVRIYVVDEDDIDCNSILLPKAFTPNNDGLNESYGISNQFILEGMEFFQVFDRSGAKLWEAQNEFSTWDGTFKGQPMTSGLYFYKVKYRCKGEEFLKIDSFTLIR